MTQQNTQRGLMIFLFILSACLSLVRLDQTSFWDDEAQVGIIARNYLATGHLTGWDGRNLFAYHNGVLLDAHLRPINPPMDYLITAASFHVFGISTWAARFPFVLIGLASLLVFALILKRDFPGNPTLQTYAFGLLALSNIFLLNIRTCRYYAPALFFCLFAFYAYRRCLASRNLSNFLLLSLAATGLFYSSYLLGAAYLISLAVIHLSFHRNEFDKQSWLKLSAAIGLFCLLVGPYAFHYHIWHRPDFAVKTSNLGKFAMFCGDLQYMSEIGCLPWLAQILLLIFVIRGKRDQPLVQICREWALLGVGYVSALCLLLPVFTMDVRYLLPAVPFCCGPLAIFLFFLHQRHKILALGLFVVLLSCNIFSLDPENTHFSLFLPAYIQEITHPYPTANREAANYLLHHAAQDDLVYTEPDYFAYPLMFYAGSKVKLCCLLDQKTVAPKALVETLPTPVFKETNFPDWIISFGKNQYAYGIQNKIDNTLAYYSRPVLQHGHVTRNSYRLVATLNVYWKQTQRPELVFHNFGPVQDFDPKTEGLYIYKRDRTQ